MALENERLPVDDTGTGDNTPRENPNRAERVDDRHPRDRIAGNQPGRDLRSTIRNAVKKEADPATRTALDEDGNEVRGRRAAEAPAAKVSTKDGGESASPSKTEIPEKIGETAKTEVPQAASSVAAPAALSKEIKAVWDTLPEAAKAEFVRREADMAKGVDQLKAKYKPYDDAFAPVMGQLQQLGKTPAEAASQLIQWQSALANPRTQAQAFQALARAHNFDLSSLVPRAQGGADPNANSNQTDPSQMLRPLIDPLANRLQTIETEFQRRDRERVQGDLANFSKDKPHYEKVRVAMAHLINTGQAAGATAQEALDKAYKMACRQDEEVFGLIQSEEQAKREADAKAEQDAAAQREVDRLAEQKRKDQEALAKARKAGVGPRAGSPSGMAIAATKRGTSVRESISEALKESSARV